MAHKENKGFSLLELVVVIAVLAILSAVAMPFFSCFRRTAMTTAAKQLITTIQKSCEIEEALQETQFISNSDKLSGYETILTSSNTGNDICNSDSITLAPNINYSNLLPTFIYHANESRITFLFKGITGSDFNTCLGLICDNNNQKYISQNQETISLNRQNLLNAMNSNSDVVMPESYSERGCSAYTLVNGSSWEEAQENAKKLGGNLTTPNNLSESKFLIDQYTEKLSNEDPNWNNGVRAGAWIGLKSDSLGNLTFADGQKLDAGFESPYGGSQEDYPDEYRNNNVSSGYHLLIKDPSGHAQAHGGLNTWWREPNTGPDYYDDLGENNYWGYNYGIAEVPIC